MLMSNFKVTVLHLPEIRGEWEEGLPLLILLAREVVQKSTGSKTNDFVFGHKVRSPLVVLWDDLVKVDPPKI